MPVVLSYGGSMEALNILTAAWTGPGLIGLFQNDWEPLPNQGISAVVPATFSGYGGLHDLIGWTAAVMVGEQAVSYANQRVWYHDGGLVSNWIFGIYVIDTLGNLRWAERDPAGPVSMDKLGDVYRYTPNLTQKSRYRGP